MPRCDGSCRTSKKEIVKPNKNEVVREYLAKFPKTATRMLARMIYKENPTAFRDEEAIRSVIRYHRGSSGTKNRNCKKLEAPLSPCCGGDAFAALPEGITSLDDWHPEILNGPMRIFLLSDLHVPFHHKEALKIAIKGGLETNPTHVILNGDVADFFSVSHWEKDPRKRDLQNEIKTALS